MHTNSSKLCKNIKFVNNEVKTCTVVNDNTEDKVNHNLRGKCDILYHDFTNNGCGEKYNDNRDVMNDYAIDAGSDSDREANSEAKIEDDSDEYSNSEIEADSDEDSDEKSDEYNDVDSDVDSDANSYSDYDKKRMENHVVL